MLLLQDSWRPLRLLVHLVRQRDACHACLHFITRGLGLLVVIYRTRQRIIAGGIDNGQPSDVILQACACGMPTSGSLLVCPATGSGCQSTSSAHTLLGPKTDKPMVMGSGVSTLHLSGGEGASAT